MLLVLFFVFGSVFVGWLKNSEFEQTCGGAAMSFKDAIPVFQMIDVGLLDPHSDHPRRHVDEAALEMLATSIRRHGVIHPLVVQPADATGRHVVIVGERRRRAAILAGEKSVPVVIHACQADELLAIQVFENMGSGLRVPLESRDSSRAIQRIVDGFEQESDVVEVFGRKKAWLVQATAAANLSPKVNALLEEGRISGTGAAVRLEKLVQKNEAKAESLIAKAEQLPAGEKLSRQVIDDVLLGEGARSRKKTASKEVGEEVVRDGEVDVAVELSSNVQPINPARRRINAGKVKMVAEILGLTTEDEEDVLARLVDEFLAMKTL